MAAAALHSCPIVLIDTACTSRYALVSYATTSCRAISRELLLLVGRMLCGASFVWSPCLFIGLLRRGVFVVSCCGVAVFLLSFYFCSL